MAKAIADYFDEEAAVHDEQFIRQMEMKPFYDAVEHVLNQCRPCSNVLVLGCGSGLEVERIRFACEVTGVDISEDACVLARRNAELNGLTNVEFVAENAFDLLRRCYDEKKHYDVIILDPPAFTKTRSAVDGALRGYKEINLRAMKMLPKGGFLVTCSCSQHVSPAAFVEMLLGAAKDARRQIRIVEARTQGKDHPILLAAPETQYLKFYVLQVF